MATPDRGTAGGRLEARIRELELRLRRMEIRPRTPAAADEETNGCTYGCTHGCTNGCTGPSCANLPFVIVERLDRSGGAAEADHR